MSALVTSRDCPMKASPHGESKSGLESRRILWPAVHARLAGKRRGYRDGEVQVLARGIDPATQRAAGKTEESGDPGVLEPDRSLPIRRNPPQPRLVIGHEQVAGSVENEVVPHRGHPASGQRSLGEQHGCGVLLVE